MVSKADEFENTSWCKECEVVSIGFVEAISNVRAKLPPFLVKRSVTTSPMFAPVAMVIEIEHPSVMSLDKTWLN